MTAKQVVTVVASRWLLMTIVFAACLGGALAYLSFTGPTYEARADILITPVAADQAVSGTGVVVESIESIRSIQTAVVLINTDEAAVRTAALMGEDWTPQTVVDAVEVAPRGQSSIVSIAARAGDPLDASNLATIFATEALAGRDEDVRQRASQLVTEREELGTAELANLDPTAARNFDAELAELRVLATNGDPSMTLVNQAAAPRAPSSPGPLLVLVLASAVGLMIGGAMSLALEQMTSPRHPLEDRALDSPTQAKTLSRGDLSPALTRPLPVGKSKWR